MENEIKISTLIDSKIINLKIINKVNALLVFG